MICNYHSAQMLMRLPIRYYYHKKESNKVYFYYEINTAEVTYTNANSTGIDGMNIQAQPGFPPGPSILSIAPASKPENAPESEASHALHSQPTPLQPAFFVSPFQHRAR